MRDEIKPAAEADTNRHPADELAMVRETIRELKEQEEMLRQQLLELPRQERMGATHKARVVDRKQSRLSIDLLEEELGDIRKFYKEISVTLVLVEKLK